MHQTFYIDIDEEITSIVERLRHARASEIILVVPKRALLIQSIVNLRILKKEADEARLQLMIVTQDKLGKILIEKAGIFVQQKMDNITDEEIDLEEENQPAEEYVEQNESMKNEKDRLDKIGSSSYFNEMQSQEEKKEEKKMDLPKVSPGNIFLRKPESEKEDGKERITNKELVLGSPKNSSQELPSAKPTVKPTMDVQPSMDMQPARSSEKPVPPLPLSSPKAGPKVDYGQNFRSHEKSSGLPDSRQDSRIESFFNQPSAISRQTKPPVKENRQEMFPKDKTKKRKDYNLSGGEHKLFWTFGTVAVLAVAAVLVYLFVPKAAVSVFVKFDSRSIDSQVVARTDASGQDGAIAAKDISTDQKADISYAASGKKTVSNQKSHGTVTIYNEYSSDSQPLVATTRFLTSDGKLFRLVKGVTVPGTSVENGATVPGTIEAEVMADESGDSFNIGPATFSIPGFKTSGSKYDKIYAKSTSAMTGGGNGSGEVKVITDDDIAAAKSKALAELNNKVEDNIKSSYGDGAIILDGALSEGDVTYTLTNSAGDVADSFQVSASVSAKALVVKDSELKDAIFGMLENAADGKKIDENSVKTDYSRSDADFDNGILTIKFHSTGGIQPDFTADSIKKEILGKNESQLKDYLGGFSNIQKVEVEYWPTFLTGRIPFLGSRVDVKIKSV